MSEALEILKSCDAFLEGHFLLSSGRTFITSQNHGYAVVGEELPAEMGEVAQVNANDGTCEGIKYKKWNCFTVQFHPEANGGPKDTEFLFDRFLNNVKAAKKEVR